MIRLQLVLKQTCGVFMILLFIGKAPSRIARAYEYGGPGDVIGTRLAERPAALLSSCRLSSLGRNVAD